MEIGHHAAIAVGTRLQRGKQRLAVGVGKMHPAAADQIQSASNGLDLAAGILDEREAPAFGTPAHHGIGQQALVRVRTFIDAQTDRLRKGRSDFSETGEHRLVALARRGQAIADQNDAVDTRLGDCTQLVDLLRQSTGGVSRRHDRHTPGDTLKHETDKLQRFSIR